MLTDKNETGSLSLSVGKSVYSIVFQFQSCPSVVIIITELASFIVKQLPLIDTYVLILNTRIPVIAQAGRQQLVADLILEAEIGGKD